MKRAWYVTMHYANITPEGASRSLPVSR